ncbi:succinate dehydrogenase [Bacteroidia bacterium]|nr:succinate dehydrogenase [Bacteroidia bacterium]
MNFTLKIWRQQSAKDKGKFCVYQVNNVSDDCSFLEMLDILNRQLLDKIEKPVCFDHDCREGICGMCGLYINGRPHGNDDGVTTCQLRMRCFKDGETIVVEPWRAAAFPIVKDLVVDRSALDKIIQAGGYISMNGNGAPDANTMLISKEVVDTAMDAAACIGCGACVAACKNASAMLFVAAKVSHLARLPQGKVEAAKRVQKMVQRMDELGFGNCTNSCACEAECPKQIKTGHIAKLNREFMAANLIEV